VRDIEKTSLSHALLYAQQEPFVLTGTIRENLLTSCPDGNIEAGGALLLTLNWACLGPSDFAGWTKYRLVIEIHEEWRNLSGGQKQCLALVKVFFMMKDASLVVLDEATLALGNMTEARVISALERCAREGCVTVVMVAHRLSTLRHADRVLMMDKGVVSQDRPLRVLESSPGPFRDLLLGSTTKVKAE